MTISPFPFLFTSNRSRKKGACRDCFNHIESHLESALDGLSIAERIAHLDRSNRCFSCEQENPVVRKIDTKLLEKFSYKDEVCLYFFDIVIII